MIFISLSIFIIIFFQILLGCEKNIEKLFLAILCGLILVFIYANLSYIKLLEGDIWGYELAYLRYSNYNIIKLFSELIDSKAKDPIFYIIGCICSHLGFSFNTFRIIIGLLFSVCFSFLIFHKSYNYSLSLIIIFAFYFTFTFTGLRQTIAISFILISYYFLLSKQIINFFIFTL